MTGQVRPAHDDVLAIEVVTTGALDAFTRDAVLTLCRDAYEEDLGQYLIDAGSGTHLLGMVHGALVSHAMIVERTLQAGDHRPLRTAYVELVATHPQVQGRGHASRLLRHLITHMAEFDLGALSPSDPAFYARLGWELWRGPLAARQGTEIVPTPDEQVMIRRLPLTPSWLNVDEALSVEWRPGEIW